MSELSETAKVILGMLRMRPRSGYELKTFVDKTVKFFWSAGYGSIYPELKRLREAGLIEGTSDPTGDRRKVIYELTPEGGRVLDAWIEGPQETHELRDEGLLQAFFSSTPDQAAAALRKKAETHAEAIARLEEIEPGAKTLETGFPLMTLEYGKALHEFSRQWCEQNAERLETETPEPKTGTNP